MQAPRKSAESRALTWMAVGAILIGTNAPMVRIAETPPTVSAFWRLLFGGVLVLLYARIARQWQPLPRRAWLWALLPGAIFASDLWLWHRSILLIGPGLSTLLANAQVFFMALAGVLLFGERLGPRFLLGIALSFFGLWLMLGGNWATLPPEYRWGVWMGLATGLSYAIFNVGLKRTQQVAQTDPRRPAPVAQVLGVVSLIGAAALGLAGAAEGASFAIPTWSSLLVLLALAAVGHCLSWVLISKAMAHLRVAVVGLMLLLQPIVAFLLDVGLFGRATSPREWLGLAFTLAGIFLASLKGRTRLSEPPA
ncbi:DMT family transporter [Luteimonas aquatica]|uniref:DMT family transporter n=1 Tax=Luteimonas aquatica TaxID=450364 RepID=UPI001F563CB3|nr:DMT family transporter [Luteimonas aquatica]